MVPQPESVLDVGSDGYRLFKLQLCNVAYAVVRGVRTVSYLDSIPALSLPTGILKNKDKNCVNCGTNCKSDKMSAK